MNIITSFIVFSVIKNIGLLNFRFDFFDKKSFFFIFKISGPAACWVPDRDAGCCGNCATPLIGSNYTWYTILFHIRPGQEAWALVTSRDILVSIRHVTNVITWPRIYESRSRDRSGGHVTSVIPYMAQVAATDQLLIGLQSLTGL